MNAHTEGIAAIDGVPDPDGESDALTQLLAQISEENEGLPSFSESWVVHDFIQHLVDAPGVLGLPATAEGVAYFLDGDYPGFVFGLRPRIGGPLYPRSPELRQLQVASWFTDCWDIAGAADPGTPEAIEATYRQAADTIREQFASLLPGYRALFGDGAGEVRDGAN